MREGLGAERKLGEQQAALGDLGGDIERRRRQDHRKLLAAIARRHIALAHAFAHAMGDEAQNLIAGLMAPKVVEFLEMIDVADQERNRYSDPARFLE